MRRASQKSFSRLARGRKDPRISAEALAPTQSKVPRSSIRGAPLGTSARKYHTLNLKHSKPRILIEKLVHTCKYKLNQATWHPCARAVAAIAPPTARTTTDNVAFPSQPTPNTPTIDPPAAGLSPLGHRRASPLARAPPNHLGCTCAQHTAQDTACVWGGVCPACSETACAQTAGRGHVPESGAENVLDMLGNDLSRA